MKYVREDNKAKYIYNVTFDSKEVENAIIDIANSVNYYTNRNNGEYGHQAHIPQLPNILSDILKGDEQAFVKLVNYPDSDDMMSIDDKIAAKVEEIASTCDNIDKKIKALDDLKRLYKDKKAGRYFDTQVLGKKYRDVMGNFDLKLISSLTKSDKVLNR